MSLATNITDLATRVATEAKGLRTLLNGNQLDNSALLTTNKANLVAAINELYGAIGGAGAAIDDNSTSGASVWSSSKTNTEIAAAAAALVDTAPGTLDTLNELAAALGDDPNFATTITNLVAGKADAEHDHAVADVTGLQGALDAKAATAHTHNAIDVNAGEFDAARIPTLPTSKISGLDTALSGKAATGHVHGAADVTTGTFVVDRIPELPTSKITGLDTTLSGKSNTGHAHVTADVTGLDTALAGKANTSHGHVIADVTGLQGALDAKASTATASTTSTGLIELATNAEVATGTDAVRAVTPASLRSVTGDPETDLVAVFEAGLV